MASESSNRVAKNTLYLYLRQAISLVITFATVGITLDILGETDYGINNIVAGAVSMFTFLIGAMAVGNQRFYSFYIGKKDFKRLKEIVGGILGIYILLSLILFILGETIGLWFLNNKLVIPPERMSAANWLYQFGLISLCLGMLSPPYIALITAHENMGFYAKISIWDAIARLITLFLLVVLPFDKLIALGCVNLSIGIITQSIYFIYVYRHYPESHTVPNYSKNVIKELLGFNVWNLCGNFAWMIKNQGTGFILNMFFGPVVNAAQGIATGVRGMSSIFTSSFQSAMVPQVTKSYASNEKEHMFKIAFSGSKMVFLLMAVVVIPALFNIELVLNLWLPKVPDHTVVFCQIMLIEVLLEQTSSLLATIQQATGKIRSYQLLIGFYGCLNLPAAYVALKCGCSPEWVFVISLFLQLFVIGVRIGYLKRVDTSAKKIYLKKVAIPCIISGLFAASICFIVPQPGNIFLRGLIILFQIIVTVGCVITIAFNREERNLCINYLGSFAKKITPKKFKCRFNKSI